MGDDRGGCKTVVKLDHGLNAIGSQDLEPQFALSRTRYGVRVFAHEKRTADPLALPVVGNRLRGGQDVGLVNGAFLRRIPRWPLVPKWTSWERVVRVRHDAHILHEPVNIDQHFSRRRFAGQGRKCHRNDLFFGSGYLPDCLVEKL